MLKKGALRRITVASLALVIAGIIYLFPDSSAKPIVVPQKIEYVSDDTNDVIFLIDQDDYVARNKINYKSTNSIALIKEIISYLTINSPKQDEIPNGFHPIIPQDTKILSVDLKDGLLKINFSAEFITIKETDEEKMIEAIVFSLTEIKDVQKIIIFVDNKQLTKLPHSNKTLPQPLTRSFGVNKIYEIDNINEVYKTTIYYINEHNNESYYVPVTKVNNNTNNKIEIIIDELKSSPTTRTNLMSYLASSAELLNYEIKEQEVNLTFNDYLLANLNNQTILEEVKYAIALSIYDNIKTNKINLLVNNNVIATIDEKSLKKK